MNSNAQAYKIVKKYIELGVKFVVGKNVYAGWMKHDIATAIREAKARGNAALKYVADMTCIDANGEWTFKPGYDPRIVLDALDLASPEPPEREFNL